MRMINVTFKSSVGLVTLLLMVTNCSSSEFGAKASDKKEGSKKADVNQNQGEMLGQSDGEDEETTEADTPVEVSGAFLSCQIDDALPKANDKEIGFGCTVFEKDGKRRDLNAVKFEFLMETLSGIKTAAKFDKTNENYHGVSSSDIATIGNHQVAFYTHGSSTPALTAKIDTWSMKDKVDILADAPEKETVFGSDSNFHIGDGNFSDESNSDCPKQLEGKDVQGEKIVIKIEVKSEYAYISANLGEICGVDRSKNYIILTNGYWNPQKPIPSKASSLNIGPVKVRKGTYLFEIRSGSSHDDLDDFVVGKIIFKAKGEVAFSDPGVKN